MLNWNERGYIYFLSSQPLQESFFKPITPIPDALVDLWVYDMIMKSLHMMSLSFVKSFER